MTNCPRKNKGGFCYCQWKESGIRDMFNTMISGQFTGRAWRRRIAQIMRLEVRE